LTFLLSKYLNENLYGRSACIRNLFDKEDVRRGPAGDQSDDAHIGREPGFTGGKTRSERFLRDAPFSPQAKADYERLVTDKKDYLPGLSSDEKKARLARMSYNSFLAD